MYYTYSRNYSASPGKCRSLASGAWLPPATRGYLTHALPRMLSAAPYSAKAVNFHACLLHPLPRRFACKHCRLATSHSTSHSFVIDAHNAGFLTRLNSIEGSRPLPIRGWAIVSPIATIRRAPRHGRSNTATSRAQACKMLHILQRRGTFGRDRVLSCDHKQV